MEPVTINFEGFNEFATQFGPYGHLVGHAIVAMFFGMIAWRQIAAAGVYFAKYERADDQIGSSHVVRAVASGVVCLASLIMVIVISANLFAASMNKAIAQNNAQINRAKRPNLAYSSDKQYCQWSSQEDLFQATYLIEGQDLKSLAISTQHSLSAQGLHDLKWLTREVDGFCLGTPDCLARYLTRCDNYEIQISQILTIDDAGDTICVYQDDS